MNFVLHIEHTVGDGKAVWYVNQLVLVCKIKSNLDYFLLWKS